MQKCLPVLVAPVVIAMAVCKGVTLCNDWGSLPATEHTGTCVIWIGGPWAGCVITCHPPQMIYEETIKDHPISNYESTFKHSSTL